MQIFNIFTDTMELLGITLRNVYKMVIFYDQIKSIIRL